MTDQEENERLGAAFRAVYLESRRLDLHGPYVIPLTRKNSWSVACQRADGGPKGLDYIEAEDPRLIVALEKLTQKLRRREA